MLVQSNHSDVGSDSDVALNWMLHQAKAAGVNVRVGKKIGSTCQKKNTINDIMNKASAPTSPANYAEILKAIKDDLPKLSQGEYKVIKL